ncbi:hypothetical protein HYV44_03455 [Candidatus Microgenomates bacterium]|nr:hypothetical protein [Candidatus Microgenomates bacterium]
MSKQIAQLKQLGLDEKEARVYLAALEFGPTTVAKLSSKSGVKRTTVYEFLDDLVARGVLIATVSGRRRLYIATPPSDLERLIERQKEALREIMPELVLLAQKGPVRPKIKVYEGTEGLKYAWLEAINHPEGSELISYSDFDKIYEVLPRSFWEHWVDVKVKRKITSRTILPSNKYAKIHTDENKRELREHIFVSQEDYSVPLEVIVCNNRTAMMSLRDEKLAIVIESKYVADSQRALFNLLWKLLKKEKRR